MSDNATMPQPRDDDDRNLAHADSDALPTTDQPTDEESLELARLMADAALDKKALDLVIIDVRGMASYADFLILCTGRNDRHVVAISDALDEAAAPYRNVVGREGIAAGQWTLLDYGDVIAHVFYGPTRKVYDLDRLWADAPRVEFEVPEELRGDEGLYEGYDVQ